MIEGHIIAYHGWGFDSRIWEGWRSRLPEEITLSAFDRGYFGERENPGFPERGARIVLAHSFGLHLVPEVRLAEADLLVVMSGFYTFHPHVPRYRKRSRQVLQQMIERFEEEPEEVLRQFYENTYNPDSPPPLPSRRMERELLGADLKALHDSCLERKQLEGPGQIAVFHGTDDRIVPGSKGRDLYNRLPSGTRYFEVRRAGHALPFTHTEQCLKLLLAELETLFPQSTRN